MFRCTASHLVHVVHLGVAHPRIRVGLGVPLLLGKHARPPFPSCPSRLACMGLVLLVSHVIVPSSAIRRGICLNHAWLSQEFSILFYFILAE